VDTATIEADLSYPHMPTDPATQLLREQPRKNYDANSDKHEQNQKQDRINHQLLLLLRRTRENPRDVPLIPVVPEKKSQRTDQQHQQQNHKLFLP